MKNLTPPESTDGSNEAYKQVLADIDAGKIQTDGNHRVMGVCKDCGHNLWMYYTPYCPICEVPTKDDDGHWNLHKVFYYVEAVHGIDHYAELSKPNGGNNFIWHALLDVNDRRIRNDSVCRVTFDPEKYHKHPLLQKFLGHVCDVIGAKEAYFEVSW